MATKVLKETSRLNASTRGEIRATDPLWTPNDTGDVSARPWAARSPSAPGFGPEGSIYSIYIYIYINYY